MNKEINERTLRNVELFIYDALILISQSMGLLKDSPLLVSRLKTIHDNLNILADDIRVTYEI